jgi:uncharacterized NAD-dependent epimerase/dehydratase family protein
MDASAIVYCEGEFGRIDGKVANGLVRQSHKYKVLGIIDSVSAGLDAGEVLDGIKSGVPIFASLSEAVNLLGFVPKFFVYGVAPLASFLDQSQRRVLIDAMEMGMDVVNGLPEFLSEDGEFVTKALECGVAIHDVR